MASLEKEMPSVPQAAMQFHIGLPMRFRVRSEKLWREAWADRMSATEIVFRVDEVLEIGKTLDIRLVLPQPGIGRQGATIVSKARVTQSWQLPENPELAFVAASLTGPRLLRFAPENAVDALR